MIQQVLRRVNSISRLFGAVAIVYASLGIFSMVEATMREVPAALAGLASTTPHTNTEAFRLPAADLAFSRLIEFQRGKSLFEIDMQRWLGETSEVELSASNAGTCSDCHLSGGRNAILQQGRFSLAPPMVVFDAAGHPAARSVGDQLNITWMPFVLTLEGEEYDLYFPRLDGLARPGFVHLTPSIIGLGLIEAIDDADILEWHLRNKMGRASLVQASGSVRVGRFGLKATHSTVRSFVEAALRNELGVPPEALHGTRIDALTAYARELGVPKRQSEIPINQGFISFERLGCAVCHRPSYRVIRDRGRKSFPLEIWPFSDFILHDLAYIDEGGTGKSYWRTAPLWGVGRVEDSLGRGAYLHDGRARTLKEAILWHGGEAALSRQKFVTASEDEQTDLLHFLEAL